MSFLGISVAGSALDAYQIAENTTSQNIANVGTPGASQQEVILGQSPPIDGSPFFPGNQQPGTQGTGVYVVAIQRVHQNSYDALFRGATSSQNSFSTQQQVLQGLQSAFGEPSNGINSAFSNFQTALQALVNNPQGNPEQTGVLTAAQSLVTSLNSAGTAIQSSMTSVIGQASSMISTINSTIDQIATLNGQIRAEIAAGDSPNTYEDQRDNLIDTLSTYVPVQTSIQADGSSLVTLNGIALVNDTVSYHLAAPVVGTTATGSPQLVVGMANDPNPSNPTPLNVNGGQLGGLLSTYNTDLMPYQNQLNDFANSLSAESARITQGSYDTTGQPGAMLFTPVVTQLPVSATNIAVGITTPSAFPIATASTLAGSLVQPMNASNNSVDTTAPLTAGTATVTAGGAAGTNTVTVSGASAVADGYAIGQTITLSPGTANSETATIASIAGNVLTLQANLVNNHAVGDNVTYGTQSLNNAPTGALSGSWTISDDGINQTWDYSTVPSSSTSTTAAAIGATAITVQDASGFTAGETIVVGQGADQELDTIASVVGNTINFTGAFVNNHSIGEAVGGNASTVNDVVNSFNAGQYGVTASFDTTSQQFVFSRDPTNIGLVHRALQGSNPTTPSFTIADSNQAGAVPQPALGTAASSLLMALGASNISGVQQNSTNAWGATNGGGANALLSLFSNNFGVPALQTTAGNVAATVPGLVTTTGNNPAFSTINVGDVLTIDAGTANQENVTVTAVNRNLGQISFVAKNPHQVNFTITTAQTQTLQTYYSNLVAEMGTDTQTAITGNTSQTALASNINAVRQSVDGINIDEETQNLIKFQNAYAAAAHVVNTLNEMLETAIGLGS